MGNYTHGILTYVTRPSHKPVY
ncbi:hypothetical protein F383_23660 [Gossypium arboreum]|uniref:Uncharacterized protein n=1 Tax=Gossypium arboreum TaxID=29729 RepID=A0A0B0P109_GOSAR|nr:hypothetical protein F383_23660 [Gossypium arboreum]